jgi:LmbE family N-acetylglucosaminyl deacetylase
MKKNIKVMFFTPHPDDIELGCPFIYLEALRLGNEVIEVLMTNGEYGTTNNDFKGKRLSRIRMVELDKANKAFEKGTNNKVRVVKMGYIDGHLPLNKESVQRVLDLLKNKKPDIVITCDPWYAQDFHEDHLNTGRTVYFALKRLKSAELPKKILYYLSTKTDFYMKCRWKDFEIVKKALAEHKTQYTPLANKFIILMYNKFAILRHLFEKCSISESLREQKIINGTLEPPEQFEKMSFRKRGRYYTYSTVTVWGYTQLIDMSLEELGLTSKFDLSDTLKKKDRRYLPNYIKKKR